MVAVWVNRELIMAGKVKFGFFNRIIIVAKMIFDKMRQSNLILEWKYEFKNCPCCLSHDLRTKKSAKLCISKYWKKENIEPKGISWASLASRCLASRWYSLLFNIHLFSISLIHKLSKNVIFRTKFKAWKHLQPKINGNLFEHSN